MDQLSLNHENSSVMVGERSIHLTEKEFDILAYLIANPDCFHTAEQIYENVWGIKPFQINTTVCVHIRHLRQKIEADPSDPKYLMTKTGNGYQYCKS